MKEKIKAFMDHGGDFNELALELATFQRRNNPQYGRLFENRKISHYSEIPAVPVGLFRDLSLTCFPPISASAVFHTSGTTGRPGRHLLQDTVLYDYGSLKHAEATVGPIPTEGVSLVTTSRLSSLGHMCRYFAPQLIPCFHPEVGVLKSKVWENLKDRHQAVFIPGTAFAFAALLSEPHTPCVLPKGSIVMVTGGFKGQRTQLKEKDLTKTLKRAFPNAAIVGEYGMSELSSQLWSKSLGDRFIAPHWMRVIAIDLVTGKPTDGPGQLRFVDLANHQTVMAIETMDHGIVHQDGTLTLLNRLPKAPSRGCSLTAEEADTFFKAKQKTVQKQHPTRVYTKNTVDPAMDSERIKGVVETLNALRTLPSEQLDPTLSPNNALNGLRHAINAITPEAIQAELKSGGNRPKSICIVVAEGVFSAPLEWIALSIASGAAVHVKAPSEHPHFCLAAVKAFQQKGFPITVSVERDFESTECIVVFGNDATIDEIKRKHPDSNVLGYGHKFSIVCCDGKDGQAFAIAQDIAAYDTRGCMAPVAIFTTGDPIQLSRQLNAELAELQQERPLGTIAPLLYPIIRREKALALADGILLNGADHAVMVQPIRRFNPIALPRIACIYSATEWEEVWDLLTDCFASLSSMAIGIDHAIPSVFDNVRKCKLGHLQRPQLLRMHDGRPIWATIAPKSIEV